MIFIQYNEILLKRFLSVKVKVEAKITDLEFKNQFSAVASETVIIIMREQRVKQSTGSSTERSQSESSQREAVRVDLLCTGAVGRVGSAIDESGNGHYEGLTMRILPSPPHHGLPDKQVAPGKSQGFFQPVTPFKFEMDVITGVQAFFLKQLNSILIRRSVVENNYKWRSAGSSSTAVAPWGTSVKNHRDDITAKKPSNFRFPRFCLPQSVLFTCL